jgi:ABC-type transporter Mla subunit MlaD
MTGRLAVTRRRRVAVTRRRRRAESWSLAIGLIGLLICAVIAYLSVIIVNGIPFTHPYRFEAIVPRNAVLINKGTEVRVAGQLDGQIRSVRLTPHGRLVTIELDHGVVGRDAQVFTGFRGLGGAPFVEVTRGDTHQALPRNGILPLGQTSSGVDLSQAAAGFDRAARADLGRTIDVYGNGLLGTGEAINHALQELPVAANGSIGVFSALTPAPGQLADVVHQLDLISAGFAPAGTDDVPGAIVATRQTFGAFAQARNDLAATIEGAVPFEASAREILPDATALLAKAAPMARALTPSIDALNRALPSLTRLLGQTNGLRQLPVLAAAAEPVLRDGEPLLSELRPVAVSLTPFAQPLGPLGDYVHSYIQDFIGGLEGLESTTGFRYNVGLASGAAAIRFTPVFTPQCGRHPYPAPNQAITERQPCSL